MAAIDKGVLVMCDGRLIKNNGKYEQGAGGTMLVGDLLFESSYIMNKSAYRNVHAEGWLKRGDFYLDLSSDFYNEPNDIMNLKYEHVAITHKYKDIVFNIKRVDMPGVSNMWLTKFNMCDKNGKLHYYKVLQGYDVGLYCYTRRDATIVNKFLGRKEPMRARGMARTHEFNEKHPKIPVF